MSTLDALTKIFKNDSGVDPAYRHGPKTVITREPVTVEGVILKWYDLFPADRAIPGEIAELARKYLLKTPLEARGLGFVILHRCGSDFYFLIVSTWRNNNELWETVFYKNGDAMDDFAIFPRDGAHKPAYCVWELKPLWHEVLAWEKFIGTDRDEAAVREWFANVYSGPA